MANTASLRYSWLLAPGSNHWASSTMYCQPWAFSLSAMNAAWALACSSVTVVARQSQLFQPMGGVGAQSWKLVLGAAGAAGEVGWAGMGGWFLSAAAIVGLGGRKHARGAREKSTTDRRIVEVRMQASLIILPLSRDQAFERYGVAVLPG